MHKQMTFVALLALAMLAGAGSLADAQTFGFSIGGGHCHGHHHHCSPGYYFGYSSPPPVYVYPRYFAPPPVTYVYPYAAAPPVVAPAPVAAAGAPVNAWKTRTEPRANALPAADRQVSIIRNPARSGGAVTFVVDDHREVTLDAGQSHTVASTDGTTVEFDRGGDFGTSRKTLGPGLHEFVVTARGWDLVNQKDRIAAATRPQVKSNALPSTNR